MTVETENGARAQSWEVGCAKLTINSLSTQTDN